MPGNSARSSVGAAVAIFQGAFRGTFQSTFQGTFQDAVSRVRFQGTFKVLFEVGANSRWYLGYG
jgi:hypothetical protein